MNNAGFEMKNGALYKGIIPEVGKGWGRQVGSDYYGGVITEVAKDKSWFKTDGGEIAMFDYRRSSSLFGRYIQAEEDEKGNLKFTKAGYPTCRGMKIITVHDTPQKTRLDPSF